MTYFNENQFISCDWGTSSFRVRLVSAPTGTVSETYTDNEGIQQVFRKWQAKGLPPEERLEYFTQILAEKVSRLRSKGNATKLILSGMASSAIGMKELPYAQTPFPPDGSGLILEKLQVSSGFSPLEEIILVSGVATKDDVMRGEESMILGLPEHFSGLVIQPGTHSKHVRIENGQLTDFKTYMTGEVFELLSTQSILANSVQKPAVFDQNHPRFLQGIKTGLNGNLLHTIFLTRTAAMLRKTSGEEGYHFLSGVLLGEELKSITEKVFLVAGNSLTELYQKTLETKGIRFEVLDADKLLIKGHCQIYASVV